MRHRVLVVDDDSGTLKVLRRMLEALGHDVTAVSTGRAAIGLADRETFDVVLCDIHMPDLDGVEVIRRLTALGGRAQLVAMTGVPDPRCAFDARAAGAHRYLAKPIQLRDLVLLMADMPGDTLPRDQGKLARSLARSLDCAPCATAPPCVREALKAIERRFGESNLTIDRVAADVDVSPSHLCRECVRSIGRTPSAYLHDLRVGHAEWLLTHTALSLKEVADQSGCNTVKSLDRQFLTRTGLLPSAYRKRA